MKPNQIFISNGPVNSNFFINRKEVDICLSYLKEFQKIVIIYGNSGSGKTSIINFIFDKKMRRKYHAKIEIDSETNLSIICDSIYNQFFGSLKHKASSKKIGANVKAISVEENRDYEVVREGNIQQIVSYLEKKRGILILDKIDSGSDELKKKLLDLITSIADKPKINMILSGSGISAYNVLGITEITPEIQEKSRLWQAVEINQLKLPLVEKFLVEGFQRLKLSYHHEDIQAIVRIFGDNLSIIHEIGLISSTKAKKNKTKKITSKIFSKAIYQIKLGLRNDYTGLFKDTLSLKEMKQKKRASLLLIIASKVNRDITYGEIQADLGKIGYNPNCKTQLNKLVELKQLFENNERYNIASKRYKAYLNIILRMEFSEIYSLIVKNRDFIPVESRLFNRWLISKEDFLIRDISKNSFNKQLKIKELKKGYDKYYWKTTHTARVYTYDLNHFIKKKIENTDNLTDEQKKEKYQIEIEEIQHIYNQISNNTSNGLISGRRLLFFIENSYNDYFNTILVKPKKITFKNAKEPYVILPHTSRKMYSLKEIRSVFNK